MSLRNKNIRMLGILLVLLIAQLALSQDNTSTSTSSLVSSWKCPVISSQAASCTCDIPHTLRCTGDNLALPAIATALKDSSVSLLDCTVRNVTSLPPLTLQGVKLHGLVISSGELIQVSPLAFNGLSTCLLALGLPNNKLSTIPSSALTSLPALERLDLSHNRLRNISNNAFKGLSNLTFVDLSENILSHISTNAFKALKKLRILRLRGNHLDSSQIASLGSQLSKTLEELDLSENHIVDALTPGSLKGSLANLKTLQLSRNNLTNVMKGALAGAKLTSIVSLTLAHNQIDVLEDDAFRALSTLTHLDLSHNRIVAVSGGSLAHLKRLKELRLAHNFLRTLGGDLISPLPALVELSVDDNDISMVQVDALTQAKNLKRLTLSDNPLNCDCNMIEFSSWLRESGLPDADISTAVCVTPPSLENGLLIQVQESELLCGDASSDLPADEPSPPASLFPSSGAVAAAHRSGQILVSTAKLNLAKFYYDSFRITLDWSVDPVAVPYTCDALFVYEEVGSHEVLVQSNPVHCNSSRSNDPTIINTALPSLDLQLGHIYRYCLVLIVASSTTNSDDDPLVVGCSEGILLVPSENVRISKLDRLEANITSEGTITVESFVEWPGVDCILSIAIYASGSVVSQQKTKCTSSRNLFTNLPPGPYQVCGAISNIMPPSPGSGDRCVTVRDSSGVSLSNQLDTRLLNISLIAASVIMSTALLAILAVLLKKIFLNRRSKSLPEMVTINTPQVFLSNNRHLSDPPIRCPNNKYVKLQATTKV